MGDRAITIRERQERWEKEILAPNAMLSIHSRGRLRAEEKCHIRTDFQRDRDRILYSKAFRRLKHKTQVFISPEGDHFRTRLTHTLEVSQISRSIARALRLNEDLTEAISLGHDLGHAPFGHAGEFVLDDLLQRYDPAARYHHNEQSLRVVDYLEEGKGLNLTYEVRDGILKHAKGRKSLAEDFLQEAESEGRAPSALPAPLDSHGGLAGDSSPSLAGDKPVTQEGELVRVADRMAYINHDIDDALRADIITFDQIPKQAIEVLGLKVSQRIGTMIVDVVETSLERGRICMSPKIAQIVDLLKDFMFKNVYVDSPAKVEEEKAKKLIEHLFTHFMDNPLEMPSHPLVRDLDDTNERARCVCDYIAGMSDRYAISLYNDIFIPKVWALQCELNIHGSRSKK
jgi:dGTPase